MFTPDDFWRIFRVLKDSSDVDPALDINTKMLAESEQQTSKQYFLKTIDQVAHLSEDYKRLRSFIIDWYASHKTIVSTQKHISDVYSLPTDHVNELIRSFGFEHGLDLVPLRNKVNMFLDLVNLYKKKGTPEALADILDYYGFSDADLIEYWLQKDNSGDLVFKGHLVRRSATGSTTLLDEDVSFDTMTQDDPHWIMTEVQIQALVNQNKINLPSKSPYFSLSSVFSLYKLEAAMAVMSRIVQDQYERKIVNGLDLPQNIQIRGEIGSTVSLLEVYTATIYTFERMFGTNPTSDLNFLHYNGTINYTTEDPPEAQDLDILATEYENIVSSPPSDRADRTAKLDTFVNNWTKSLSTNVFNTGSGVAETILTTINPDLKNECDAWFTQGDEGYLITYLVGTLDTWIRSRIDTQTPSLVVTALGFGFREEVGKIIEFFKPYRARLAFLDTSYAIRNPLTESIRIEDDGDDLHAVIQQTHTDQLEVLDEFFTDIYLSFEDVTQTTSCFYNSYTTYDVGDYYDFVMRCDLLEMTMWTDFEDNVEATDSIAIGENIDLVDYPRGMSGPMMWDSGGSFDTPVQAPIVNDRDNLVIEIWPPIPEEELDEIQHDYLRGSGGPVIWDKGNTFDEDMQAPVVTDSIEIIII